MKNLIQILAILLIAFTSCKKENFTQELSGAVQKGPFLNGTAIDLFELNSNLAQTGKAYSVQISDNSGAFQLSNVSFVSQYIQLKANGYYFNEVTGKNSNAPLTLYALTDISNKSRNNINILSHLEKSRIEYLVSTGKVFTDAKKQADQEILRIFSISKPDIANFETLDISKNGDDNAILLAVSVILQGYRTESELSGLLADISTDIRQDGILNSASLGALLINDARLFNLTQIRNNIEQRYLNMGMTVVIPNFEKYVQIFTNNTTYQFNNNITYPEYSNYGENVLFANKANFGRNLSLAANLPKGTSLKIIIKGGVWYYRVLPDGPINWTVSTYDENLQEQIFTVDETDKRTDLSIDFPPGTYTIEYYENNSTTPTRVKTFSY
jgi:hypothetical protein